MAMMRAALYDEYGPPDVIYDGVLPLPELGPDDVLVRVSATTVNGGDLLMRSGRLKAITGKKFPRQLGVDVVGDVVRPGAQVSAYHHGDRVWGVLAPGDSIGTAAQYVAIPSERLSPAPENLDSVGAVSLLAGGTTALRGLRDEAQLQPGERLLVRGAGGGVGSMAVQLGKHLGAHVTALANSTQVGALEALGADAVIDYRTTPAAALDNYDVVFDTRGTELAAFRRHLSPTGRMVTIAVDAERPLRSLGCIVASTVFGPRRVRFFSGRPTRPLLDELRVLAHDGTVRPVVHSTYPLCHVSTAHRALEAGGVLGKIVVDVFDEGSAAGGSAP